MPPSLIEQHLHAGTALPPVTTAAGVIDSHLLGRIDYAEALELQEQLVRQRIDGVRGDTLLLLEHPDVYTIGRRRDTSSLGGTEALPHPVHVISRGGQATWHGPGQLVGYPILDLNRRGRDLHRYLRALESVVIGVAEGFGVPAGRMEGQTGVWAGGRKLASIGVGVRRWISCHGFALNVDPSMAGFQAIVPCGIAGVEMTSLARERQGITTDGPPPDWRTVAALVPQVLAAVLDRELAAG